jgi:tRNA-5-taurinomethyluridine 2-sulfurtransferase
VLCDVFPRRVCPAWAFVAAGGAGPNGEVPSTPSPSYQSQHGVPTGSHVVGTLIYPRIYRVDIRAHSLHSICFPFFIQAVALPPSSPTGAGSSTRGLDTDIDIDALLASDCEAGISHRCAVLFSGGVDSSTALALAQRAGHHVEAFYLQIWFQEDFRNTWDACPWEEDLDFCRQTCDQLGITLHVVPFTETYWERVVGSALDEIRAGYTPNPDIWCNSRVKFGAFLDYLRQNHPGEFDRVVSGHYARVRREPRGSPYAILDRCPDPVKDQTYFLSGLSPTQLSMCMFPLGGLMKSDVRSLATTLELPAMVRRDSQGICFLGKVRFEEFVAEHLGEWPGPLVDAATNRVVGYHQGFWFYTTGQRKGIRLPGGPWYVARKDVRWNAVYIARPETQREVASRWVVCEAPHWLRADHRGGRLGKDDETNEEGGGSDTTLAPSSSSLVGRKGLTCKVRHGPGMVGCRVEAAAGDDEEEGECSGWGAIRVIFDRADGGLAAGQYVVFYDGEECVASAPIRRVEYGEP